MPRKGLVGAVILLAVLCVAGLSLLVFRPAAPERIVLREPESSVGIGGTSPAGIGQFIPLDKPQPAPPVEFATRTGEPVRLADFHGRVVLVNLWATWCAPCVREMPSLDRLQARLGSDLTILALSEDRGGARVVDPFLEKLGLGKLAIYLDPKGAVGQAFAVRGLPTSLLIDRDGNIRARLEGAAAWDAPAMIETLQQYLDPPGPSLKKAER
jgi:thiol-disulfide isomerase/thioredoxin